MNRPDPATPHGARWRSAALLLGCGVLMALLAATPLAWFALSDAALLDRPAAMTQPYTSVTPTGEDFYLIRQLNTQAELVNADYTGGTSIEGTSVYTPSGDEMYTMRLDYTMGEYTVKLLTALQQAGVLTEDWVGAALTGIEDDDYGVWYSMDSLGFLRLSRFDEANGDLRMQIIVESRTGKPVNLFLTSDTPLPAPDTGTVLPAWVRFNELDGLGDWVAPADTDFAENGLYSARGGVLLSAGLLDPQYRNDTTLYSLCMNLGLWAPDATRVGELPQGWQVGALRPLESGNLVLQPTGYNGSFGVLCRLQADGMAIECGYPGCTHDTEACPAWVAAISYYSTAQIDGEAYLLYSSGGAAYRDYMQNEYPNGEEYTRLLAEVEKLGTENDLFDVQAQALLGTQPARIEKLSRDRQVRSWCNEQPSQEMIYWGWEDGAALYAVEYDTTTTAYVPHCRLLRTPLDGSEPTALRLPDGADVVLANGTKVLLSHRRSVVDLEALARSGSSWLSYYISSDDRFTYTLYDLNTGERQPLFTASADEQGQVYPLLLTDEAVYYMQYTENTPLALIRLDLGTGAQRNLLDPETGAGLSWNYLDGVIEADGRRYLCIGAEAGVNTGNYRMLIVDIASEDAWVVDNWLPGPDGVSSMASLVCVQDGLLYARIGYDRSLYNGYIVPCYAVIDWQDYLAGGADWRFLDPWTGATAASGG